MVEEIKDENQEFDLIESFSLLQVADYINNKVSKGKKALEAYQKQAYRFW